MPDVRPRLAPRQSQTLRATPTAFGHRSPPVRTERRMHSHRAPHPGLRSPNRSRRSRPGPTCRTILRLTNSRGVARIPTTSTSRTARPRLLARGLRSVTSRSDLVLLQRPYRGGCTGGAPLPPRAPLRGFGPAPINVPGTDPPGLTRRAAAARGVAPPPADAPRVGGGPRGGARPHSETPATPTRTANPACSGLRFARR